MNPPRFVLAIRDKGLDDTLRQALRGAGMTVLGSIDPGQPAGFLNWPDLADAVLMEAEELVALYRRRRSVLWRLNPAIRLLVALPEERLAGLLGLPCRIDGLIFLKPGREHVTAQIQLALAGYCGFPSSALQRMMRHDWLREVVGGFTAQERRVLDLLAAGRSNREIGAALGCAETRAKSLVRSLLNRLGVRNRTLAALLAARIAAPLDNITPRAGS